MDSQQLCRLCLQSGDDLVNIWENFEDSTIATVVQKHFWFQVSKGDSFPEWLCAACWMQTKTFHNFYLNIECRHASFYKTVNSVSSNLSPQERCGSPAVAELDIDLNSVKCEEPEVETKVVNFLIDEKRKSDVNDGSSSEQMDNGSNNEPNNVDSVDERPKKPTNKDRKEQEDAQIREFFSMECELCSDMIFETIMSAKQHYRKIHKMNGYLTCCGNKYDKRCKLLEHIRYHTDPDGFRCSQCDKTFKTKNILKLHVRNHGPSEARVYKCSLCSSSFITSCRLKTHIKRAHAAKNGKKFPCDKCGKEFWSNESLTSHIRCVHEPLFEHVCETCARRFKTKQSLLEHITNEHSTVPPAKVQCDICGDWLKHKVSLRVHLRRHKRSTDTEVACTICKKTMRDQVALKRHLRRAHGEKRFSCTLCNKSFRRSENIKEHMAWHTGEDLYDCPYCEKKFKSNANMYSHRKKAHLTEWTRDFSKYNTVRGVELEKQK